MINCYGVKSLKLIAQNSVNYVYGRSLLWLLLFGVAPAALSRELDSAVPSKPPRPNIVIILADDLGYGSVNCNGAPESMIRTPHVNQLAKEGMRFTDAHSPSTVCTPTRYSLLTGRMAFRTGMRSVFTGVGGPCLIEEGRRLRASDPLSAQLELAQAAGQGLGLGPGQVPQLHRVEGVAAGLGGLQLKGRGPTWPSSPVWEVAPPSLVKIPFEASIPWTSSGLVKGRTMITS